MDESDSVGGGRHDAVTRRAYTMRLRGGSEGDVSWRHAVWETHRTVNAGAKFLGEFLLTLRGGLSHSLEGQRPDGDEAARRIRRILLALSWLSVEDARGAPVGDVRVADAEDPARGGKVVEALRSILAARGVAPDDIVSWVTDCRDSLSARIRDDAVWVNRSAAFDGLRKELPGLDRAYAELQTFHFFGGPTDYLRLRDDDAAASVGGKDGPDFKQKARQWVVTNFGSGKKSDVSSIVRRLEAVAGAELGEAVGRPQSRLFALIGEQLKVRAETVEEVESAFGWVGRPSKGRLALRSLPEIVTHDAIDKLQTKFREEAAAKTGSEGLRAAPRWAATLRELLERSCGMPFVGERDHTGEFSTMLDQAARRVGIAHSWIKLAEAERQRFEEAARRLGEVPPEAATWLDAFTARRSSETGAASIEGYRIRPRAIAGWREVVKSWGSQKNAGEAKRVEVVRELQSSWSEDGKFGDGQLFESLAVESAECVWRCDGAATPDPLLAYVAASDAVFKRQRFKVPAYRHPDPLRNPVFTDFGNSRWAIRYAAHRGTKRKSSSTEPRRGLQMHLWDGRALVESTLRWSSKRLFRELGLGADPSRQTLVNGSRDHRLARSAIDARNGQVVRPEPLFRGKDWNGRLQAPRTQLDAIARRVEAHGWDETAKRMLARLRWLVTLSADLPCRGPFIDYARKAGMKAGRDGRFFPNSDVNKSRSGDAKLALSRLPGLRVLSVDLGHRFAAACAVWETTTTQAVAEAARRGELRDGGVGDTDLFAHVRSVGPGGKPRTAIYRRIGPDRLPDGTEHPAPWARLDRQFVIRLPGEDRPPRKASRNETAAVRDLERGLGRHRDASSPLPSRVEELMSEAVRSARIGLARLGLAARIAYAFKPDGRRLLAGGRDVDHTIDTRTAAVADALEQWHARATDERWRDGWAAEAWTNEVLPLLERPLPAAVAGGGRRQPRARGGESRKILMQVAAALLASGTDRLHSLWSEQHRHEATRWPARLRWLSRWLLPRGLRTRKGESEADAIRRRSGRAAARGVGGLSLSRISVINELRRVQLAYAMRPEPHDPRANVPEHGQRGFDGFSHRALVAMERLRTQRVRQLASRIAEAALGVGRVQRLGRRDPERPRGRTDAACHAVVIEDLDRYRPDELQTRRENRALMSWSAGKVRDFLSEACQLHGLHFRQVSPNFTSRQCSRTGRAGLRCEEVPVAELLSSPRWSKVTECARDRLAAGGVDSIDQLVVATVERWSAASAAERSSKGTVILPRPGGDLFVADVGRGPGRLQADLNAAANVGLRSLLDPDFPARWWWVACEIDAASGAAVPRADRVKGSACFGPDPSKPERFGSLSVTGGAPPRRKRGRRIAKSGSEPDRVNYWSDPSGRALRNAESGGRWLPTAAYWPVVRSRVAVRLVSLNDAETHARRLEAGASGNYA